MTPELWARVEEMVGNPDYAVAFAVWPWPDGGWMAGVALIDKPWAEIQGLAKNIAGLPELDNPDWNIYDGFSEGINKHGASAEQALEDLLRAVGPRQPRPWKTGP